MFCSVSPSILFIIHFSTTNFVLLHENVCNVHCDLLYSWCNAPFLIFNDNEQCQLIIESLIQNDSASSYICVRTFWLVQCKTVEEMKIQQYKKHENNKKTRPIETNIHMSSAFLLKRKWNYIIKSLLIQISDVHEILTQTKIVILNSYSFLLVRCKRAQVFRLCSYVCFQPLLFGSQRS